MQQVAGQGGAGWGTLLSAGLPVLPTPRSPPTLPSAPAPGLQTAGAGRDLAEAEVPAVVPLPPCDVASPGRLLVFAAGHASSGVPADWAAGRGRPGVLAADLSPAGVRHLAELVARHKRPGDLVLVSVHWGSNWGYGVEPEQREFARALIDTGWWRTQLPNCPPTPARHARCMASLPARGP